MNSLLPLIILPFLACQSTLMLGEISPELITARRHYRSELKKTSRFLLGCKKVRHRAHDKYYVKGSEFIPEDLTMPKTANLFTLTFKVSGCDHRKILVIANPDRKTVCDFENYEASRCEIVSDESIPKAFSTGRAMENHNEMQSE